MALIYDVVFDSTTRVLSLLDKAGNVISSCEVPSKEPLVDDPNKPLMLRAIENNSSVTLTKNGELSNTYQTSNDGINWTDYTLGTKISLNKGWSVYFRCSNHPTTQSDSNFVQFTMEGKIEAWHNAYSMISSSFTDTGASVGSFGMYKLFMSCESLTKAPLLVNIVVEDHCYWSMFNGCTSLTQAPALPATTLANYCYVSMFGGCTSLTQAPALPATTLADHCYWNMFNGCTSLTQAPALPATTLADHCYTCMFSDCTSIMQAPALPATTLADYCYWQMFDGCTSLTQAPALPATTLANKCYYSMFNGCTSLTQAPALPATTLANYCYNSMFVRCTSLTQAPALPATTLTTECYSNMFYRCSSLTQAPALPATTLADSCYRFMFNGCTSLTQAPALPATALKRYCYENMFGECTSLNEVRISATSRMGDSLDNWLENVSATGDFYCDPNATIFTTDSASGIPTGWVRRNIAILNDLTLTATADNSSVKLTKKGTLSNTYEVNTGSGWMAYAFDTVIPLNAGQSCKWRCSAHPTTQSPSNCVQFVMTGSVEASGNCNSMLNSDFDNITSLTGYDYAFYNLFYGCSSLTQAPELPATTLAGMCYYGMFQNCSSLTQAPELPATTLANDCYYSMFDSCTSLTQAPQLPATNLTERCYNFMFFGCTSLTQAPQLPATNLTERCYNGMFSGCKSLTEVCISATTTATHALTNWLNGVATSGTIYADPSFTGLSGIPSGWRRLNIADYPQT